MQALITIAIVVIILIVVGFTPQPLGNKPAVLCEKDWVDVLSALGTPIIALMTAWVGYQQWQTTEKVRKGAAQQKYADNYEKVATAIHFVVRKGRVDDEVLNNLLFARNEALLYLSSEIIRYTEDLVDKAIDLSVLQEEMADMQHGPEKIKKNREAAELKKKLGSAKPHEIYRKYLAIE